MSAKSYGQACALSVTLDIIGSRWTMLILRDLMGGPARYAEIQKGLKGIASNLLNDRLKTLEDDGLIEKVEGPGNTSRYQLTELGEQVRPALDELGRLGLTLRTLRPGPPPEPTTLRFFAQALQALLSDALPGDPLKLGLQLDDEWLTIDAGTNEIRVTYGPPQPGVPVVHTGYATVRDVLVNGLELDAIRAAATTEPPDSDVLDRFLDLVERSVRSRASEPCPP